MSTPSNSIFETKRLNHLTHPQHSLKQIYSKLKFHCELCGDAGNGMRYKCKECSYNLHEQCASLSNSLISFLHPQHPLELTHKSQLGLLKFLDHCYLCRRSIKSWVYCCKSCKFYLHPGCSRFSEFLNKEELHPPHQLKLEELKYSGVCEICEQSVKHWRYYCIECDVHVHLECTSGEASKMVDNGNHPKDMGKLQKMTDELAKIVTEA